MSKQVQQMRRMLLIFDKLKRPGQVSKQELLDYVNRKMEDCYGYEEIGMRTLERDISDITMMFRVDISFDRSCNCYAMNRHESNNRESYELKMAELLMNFDLLNSLSSENSLSSFVLAEHHRPQHSEWLPTLIRAIKGCHPLAFKYVDYRRDNKESSHRVEPHYLKESNQRWYLLAFENSILKTFGVDRIRELDIYTDQVFRRSMDIDVSEMFRDCYGIWNDERMPIEEIELRYSPLDGRFIKSAPIHHSQQILIDNDEEFRITLRLRITNDFVMELLSRSKSLEVIRPLHLREELHNIYVCAAERNAIHTDK